MASTTEIHHFSIKEAPTGRSTTNNMSKDIISPTSHATGRLATLAHLRQWTSHHGTDALTHSSAFVISSADVTHLRRTNI